MDDIRIDIGVYTTLTVDLSGYDFTGISKVIMTVKNKTAQETILTREFTPPAASHTITITPEESEQMRKDAEYDFVYVDTSGKCYKNGENGKVMLRRGCGECPRESS